MEVSVIQTEKIREFISEVSFTKPEELKDETLLFEQGIFDSLGFLNLISHITDEYGIEVADTELMPENFKSINAIVAFIDRKKSML
ncbi:acyl carrier protein [uncultured Draconibacterium sp.]|uniref:acyl carrier protein n=1 Tax=uncultured Draconibacterium sp. TaxID=1573823 RepID=UPI0029C92206|nr:acyl carrier protein [uncultured Draconibacterium sp.]